MPPLPRLAFPSCTLLGVVLLTTQQYVNTARHPICRVLEDAEGHRRPTRPSVPQPYRCDGDHAEALCSKLDDDYSIQTVISAHGTEEGGVTGSSDTASAGTLRKEFPSGTRQEVRGKVECCVRDRMNERPCTSRYGFDACVCPEASIMRPFHWPVFTTFHQNTSLSILDDYRSTHSPAEF